MLSQKINWFARSVLGRALTAIFVFLLVALPQDATAAPNLRKYAGIVVDAKSGKVLFESNADAQRYPASVTKVMTLYVLFQELAAGNIKLSTKMPVSKHAASASPTKLGLKKGSTITVENAIKALVTLSANDMSRVIAEFISGSESKFADRMTATARALGMKRTTYRNASGLPDRGQVTTVRDQAILGRAIYQHFPKYYEYFQTRSFSYGKRTYGNHNRLLGANGVDGIKTGYISAAGYNLLTAARQNGHHIVVVGFGFESGGARDAKVRAQVKKYLPKSRTGDYMQTAMIPAPGRKGGTVRVASTSDPVLVVPMPFPSFRSTVSLEDATVVPAFSPEIAPAVATATPEPEPVAVQPVALASIPDAPVPATPIDIGLPPALDAANQLGHPAGEPPFPPESMTAWSADGLTLGAPPAALGSTAPSAPLLPPVGIGEHGEPIDLMTSGSIRQHAALAPSAAAPEQVQIVNASAAPVGGWVVQIGAAPTEGGAHSLLTDATGRISSLADFRPYTERFEKNGQVFYRARFTGFSGRDDAASMCNQLKKAKMSCLALQS